ncbi:MAG TPA: hypothetical protein VMJ10_18715 [Kofleriaceae bacterium]|nr:hypothetical protein [Kofleriaceae bacterium]
MASSSVARADNPCLDAHYVHAFDPRLPTGRCVDVAPLPIRTGHGMLTAKIIRFDTLRVDAAPIVRDLQDFARRVAGASNQLGDAMPDKLTILLDSEPPAAEARAASWAHRVDGECTIAYHYNSTDPRKLFQVAHALFHCMQAKAWDDARLGSSDADWWAEGSAELFASLAYAGSGLTDVDAAAFQANEGAVLTSRSSDAVVFFDWFLAAKSAGELNGLLDGVHALAGSAALREMRDAVSQDDWIAFEEAYYDHHIAEPGGHPLPITDSPTPPVTRIDSSGVKTFTAEPFVVKRAIVEFAEGHQYDLDHSTLSPKFMQWSESVGAWADPPATVHACHETKRYRAVIGTVDHSETISKHVTSHEDHDCPCIVGNWQQTADSLGRIATRAQAHGAASMACSYQSGGTLLVVHGDHTGGDNYQALVTQCTGRTMTATSTANGTLGFTWTVTADQLQFSSTGSTAKTHTVINMHGRTIEQDVPLPSAGASARMRCERDHLHLEYGSDAYDYTRTTPPPPGL